MSVSEAIAGHLIGGRLWFYTNYHCNLACTYCLTDSRPTSPKRLLDEATILRCADEAVALGFSSFGVTGGEPFLLPRMPEVLGGLAERLPTIVLTNGTLFTPKLLAAIQPFNALPLTVQLSLDSAEAVPNDSHRNAGTYQKVIDAIKALKHIGLRVRIGTTIDDEKQQELQRLRTLLAALGIAPEDHVVRPIAKLGRARSNDLGIEVQREDLAAELTLTAEGAYWSPAAPIVEEAMLSSSLLLTRAIVPLHIPADAMIRAAGNRITPALTRVSCA